MISLNINSQNVLCCFSGPALQFVGVLPLQVDHIWDPAYSILDILDQGSGNFIVELLNVSLTPSSRFFHKSVEGIENP